MKPRRAKLIRARMSMLDQVLRKSLFDGPIASFAAPPIIRQADPIIRSLTRLGVEVTFLLDVYYIPKWRPALAPRRDKKNRSGRLA